MAGLLAWNAQPNVVSRFPHSVILPWRWYFYHASKQMSGCNKDGQSVAYSSMV